VSESQKVTLGDIESKLRDLTGGTQSAVGSVAGAPPAIAGVVVGGVLFVAAIFLLGRRRGRREAPVLEIRRI
jgi:hypothetical protein